MDLEERQASTGGAASGGKKLAKPNAIMFFHIPLYVLSRKLIAFNADVFDVRKMTGEPADVDTQTSKQLDVGATEKYGGANKDSGFFQNAVLKALEISDPKTMQGALTEVKIMANGHVHTADNCHRVKGVWSCFGGGGSYAGYGKREFAMFI